MAGRPLTTYSDEDTPASAMRVAFPYRREVNKCDCGSPNCNSKACFHSGSQQGSGSSLAETQPIPENEPEEPEEKTDDESLYERFMLIYKKKDEEAQAASAASFMRTASNGKKPILKQEPTWEEQCLCTFKDSKDRLLQKYIDHFNQQIHYTRHLQRLAATCGITPSRTVGTMFATRGCKKRVQSTPNKCKCTPRRTPAIQRQIDKSPVAFLNQCVCQVHQTQAQPKRQPPKDNFVIVKCPTHFSDEESASTSRKATPPSRSKSSTCCKCPPFDSSMISALSAMMKDETTTTGCGLAKQAQTPLKVCASTMHSKSYTHSNLNTDAEDDLSCMCSAETAIQVGNQCVSRGCSAVQSIESRKEMKDASNRTQTAKTAAGEKDGKKRKRLVSIRICGHCGCTPSIVCKRRNTNAKMLNDRAKCMERCCNATKSQPFATMQVRSHPGQKQSQGQSSPCQGQSSPFQGQSSPCQGQSSPFQGRSSQNQGKQLKSAPNCICYKKEADKQASMLNKAANKPKPPPMMAPKTNKPSPKDTSNCASICEPCMELLGAESQTVDDCAYNDDENDDTCSCSLVLASSPYDDDKMNKPEGLMKCGRNTEVDDCICEDDGENFDQELEKICSRLEQKLVFNGAPSMNQDDLYHAQCVPPNCDLPTGRNKTDCFCNCTCGNLCKSGCAHDCAKKCVHPVCQPFENIYPNMITSSNNPWTFCAETCSKSCNAAYSAKCGGQRLCMDLQHPFNSFYPDTAIQVNSDELIKPPIMKSATSRLHHEPQRNRVVQPQQQQRFVVHSTSDTSATSAATNNNNQNQNANHVNAARNNPRISFTYKIRPPAAEKVPSKTRLIDDVEFDERELPPKRMAADMDQKRSPTILTSSSDYDNVRASNMPAAAPRPSKRVSMQYNFPAFLRETDQSAGKGNERPARDSVEERIKNLRQNMEKQREGSDVDSNRSQQTIQSIRERGMSISEEVEMMSKPLSRRSKMASNAKRISKRIL